MYDKRSMKRSRLLIGKPAMLLNMPHASPKRRKLSNIWNKYDPLTLVPVTEDDFVVGAERVWSPIFYMYAKLFRSTFKDVELDVAKLCTHTLECSFPHYAIDFEELVHFANTLELYQEVFQIEDEAQQFWMYLCEQLSIKIYESCKLDKHAEATSVRKLLMPLYQLGVSFLLHKNPSYARFIVDRLCKTLQSALEGEDFWSFNPILLVQVLLYVKLDLSHRIESIFYNEKLQDVAFIHQHLTRKVIFHACSEQDVCEQEFAIDFVEDCLSEKSAAPRLSASEANAAILTLANVSATPYFQVLSSFSYI